MSEFDPAVLKNLYKPPRGSHKGQNGKLLIIGGSELFHAASLWALTVASRLVDMVFYSSVEMNNKIVENLKTEFRNGIVVSRNNLDSYINEADCVLIGPGLPRSEGQEEGDNDTKELTKRLLSSYPEKKWVIDGGSLQVIEPGVIPETAIITPHRKEFSKLFNFQFPISPSASLGASNFQSNSNEENEQTQNKISEMAKKYGIVILLKGERDIICSQEQCTTVSGGNSGMTKGGTGDVLAGLIAALYCKNDAFLSACAGSYINKKAGESLFQKVGYYFNASDLADEIPKVMKSSIVDYKS